MLLALREVIRAKARFALLSGAVGLLVFLIVFQQALFGGLITSFIGAVENQDAPILVFNDQARSNVEGSFLLPAQAEAISRVDGVADSRLIGQNTFTVATASAPEDAVLFGYTLGELGEPRTLRDGRLPLGPNEAVASAADADKGFDIGDTIEILGDDGPTVTIVGLGEDLRWSVAPTLFVSYETFEAAQAAVNPDATVVLPSLVAVRPADGVDIDTLTDTIDAQVDGVEALTNAEAVAQNPGVQGVSSSITIILALAFVVVILVVGFFFLILTVQKAKPLTLLRAIGSPSSYLVRNLIVQIAVVMTAGIVIGVGSALLVAAVSPTGDVPIEVEVGSVITTVVALFVLAMIGGAVSIRRVLRIDPIRATADSGRTL
ncbi:MAG: ABC transporter permease [Acidimicrobiia bacterium]|nr:ABC transporter permease [Acidimicrobiia bacterium]